MVYPIFFPPLVLLYVSLSFVLLPLALIFLFFKFRNSKLGFHGPFLYIICSDSYDSKGNIELPVIGKIAVAGLTTEQARELIRIRAAQFYKDPSVNLRFANFKITILGEVNKPGTYVVSNEKINILDALGLAGDLTVYGIRDNVTLIRQHSNGSRELVKLDLTSSKILSSPYYWLHQNDYIYVEPSKSKIVSSDAIQNRNISIVTAIGASLISVLAILLSTGKL